MSRQDMPDDPTHALYLLFSADTNAKMREVIRAHPILLDPRTADFVRQSTAGISIPAHLDRIDLILFILEQCREKGADSYFAEVEPLRNLLRSLAQEAARPLDLSSVPDSEDDQTVEVTGSTVAAMCVSAYRGLDYPHGAANQKAIKAAGEDHYLLLLNQRTTNELDWATAARKIEHLQRKEARRYIAELAQKYPDDPAIAQIGFEFIKCRTPNAFALRAAEDDSVAIGIDPGLQSLVAILFHAAQIAVYNGTETEFVDLAADLVKGQYLGVPADVEERILELNEKGGLSQRNWADWAGLIAQRFLIGHEVAHIHLGHLNTKHPRRIRVSPDRAAEDEVTAFDHETEFQADAWSARELYETSTGLMDRVAACTMPAIFMSLMALVEELYFPNDAVSQAQRRSHPAAWQRARRLSSIGRGYLPPGSPLSNDEERLLELPDSIDAMRSTREFQLAVARTTSLARELGRALQHNSHDSPPYRRQNADTRRRAEEAAACGLSRLGYHLPATLPATDRLVLPAFNRPACPDTPGRCPAGVSEFHTFTAAWGDVLAACLLGVQNEGLVDRFIDFCFCEVLFGSSAFLESRPDPAPEILRLSDRHAAEFEVFSVARAYAHMALGHQPVGAGVELDHEFAADELGLKAALQVSSEPELTYFGIAGNFCALLLLERGSELTDAVHGGCELAPVFPPAIRRRLALYNLAKELVPAEALLPAMANLNRVEDITIRMWQPLEAAFLDRTWLAHAGPGPTWTPRDPYEKTMALLSFKTFCLGQFD